ncbi:class A beta-lactamase [Actinomadura logoneensis]|uniref:Beta-lactamase n=1 Tax=Actinomadura logoneensis TaxID=2293572 RepID=A0A372JVJ5_9ACTN|nr:class A beta-lactamase [Actinomadura logoneensis]RFU43358.1 class A beta-lactamase [Actinomadura logoneensis]
MDHRATSRRALLTAVALLPLAGCGEGSTPPKGSSAPRPAGSPTRSPAVSLDPAGFAALERKYKARLGLFAVATGTGATVAYRPDERFAFCSTFKPLAAAAVLDRRPVSELEKRVRIRAADVNSISPITRKRIGSAMSLRELCDAAIRFSDGTAGNLLVRDIGGPAALNAYLRRLGDPVTRMDDLEPELNRVGPGDPRDTTTPRAITADYRSLVLGDALPAAKRALLAGWLDRSVPGADRIRAALPPEWTIAHKTGTGDYGRAADVAVLRPPQGRPPLVLGILSDREGYTTPPAGRLLAEAARLVVTALA